MYRLGCIAAVLFLAFAPFCLAQKKGCAAKDRQDRREVAGFIFQTFFNGETDESCLQILRGGRVVYEESDLVYKYTLGQEAVPEAQVPAVLDGTDLMGNGHRNMIVTSNTGGAHCCLTVMVYELKERPERIAKLEVGDTEYPYFARGGDGIYRFHAEDWSLVYWPSSFAGSPNAPIVLRNTNRGYHLDLDAMRTPMPSEQDVQKARSEAKELFDDFDASRSGIFWHWVMQWIYKGHDDFAWEFVDGEWPATIPGKEKWTGDFCARLADSPYWADLQPFMTHAPATCISAAEEELRQVKVLPSGSIRPNLLRTP